MGQLSVDLSAKWSIEGQSSHQNEIGDLFPRYSRSRLEPGKTRYDEGPMGNPAPPRRPT